MWPAVGNQIAAFGFFEKGQSALADSAQLSQHGFLAGEEFRIEGNGSFTANKAHFDDEKWQMKSLIEGNGKRFFADYAIGISEHAAFDLAQMGDEFGCGPATPFVRGEPEA